MDIQSLVKLLHITNEYVEGQHLKGYRHRKLTELLC